MSGGANGPHFMLCGETGLRVVEKLQEQHPAMQYEEKEENSKSPALRLLATQIALM